ALLSKAIPFAVFGDALERFGSLIKPLAVKLLYPRNQEPPFNAPLPVELLPGDLCAVPARRLHRLPRGQRERIREPVDKFRFGGVLALMQTEDLTKPCQLTRQAVDVCLRQCAGPLLDRERTEAMPRDHDVLPD